MPVALCSRTGEKITTNEDQTFIRTCAQQKNPSLFFYSSQRQLNLFVTLASISFSDPHLFRPPSWVACCATHLAAWAAYSPGSWDGSRNWPDDRGNNVHAPWASNLADTDPIQVSIIIILLLLLKTVQNLRKWRLRNAIIMITCRSLCIQRTVSHTHTVPNMAEQWASLSSRHCSLSRY